MKEKTLCIGEPLPNFFFFLCFNLVIFKQIVFRVALLKFVKGGFAKSFNAYYPNKAVALYL